MAAPAWFSSMTSLGKIGFGVASLMLATAAVAGVQHLTGTSDRDDAVVERVVDGDTIDVALRGDSVRVRLLNVDTPETVDPDQPVQCLGPEATSYLESRLPSGTAVTLIYDHERLDGYGRTLAGVYLGESLVNADIARQGLGTPMLIEPNDRFYDEVARAHEAALTAQTGLYNPAVECTLPAQVAALEQSADEALAGVAALGAGVGIGVGVFDSHSAALGLVLDGAHLAIDALTTPPFPDGTYGEFNVEARRRINEVIISIGQAADQVEAAKATEVARAEAERIAAQAAARAAAEAEAARVAAEQAAEAAAADAAERRRASGSGTSASQSSGGSSSSGGSGYTGCRKYAPGGKTWTPIPC